MSSSYGYDLERLRRQEYPTLQGVTYLDHAGTTPYAKSLIKHFSRDMVENLYGNPHSASPSSDLSTRRIVEVRKRMLQFFHADPEHFDLVFVANASAAIKLVVEAFRDVQAPGYWYGYHRDAHTSLVGIRQLAASSRCFESDKEVETWIQDIENGDPSKGTSNLGVGLFAYPAQSNMNGHRLPLRWAGDIRARTRRCASLGPKIYTLLDAAAYVMTAQLDLGNEETAPDFTALSFYKIFGFPDLGALIVRKESGNILRRRRYFGGGTVEMVTVMKNSWHAKKDITLHESLEDGTLPFHHIVALGYALDVLGKSFGSMTKISEHTCALAAYTHSRLQALRHANGRPVCKIYRDQSSRYGDSKTQGPTIAFNLQNSQGGWVGKSDVERLAIVRGIHLRTGGVCNPGGIAEFCDLAHWELRRNFSEGMRCGDDFDIMGGKPTGVVRVSFGAMSSQKDADTFLRFIVELFVENKIGVAQKNLSTSAFHAAESHLTSITVFPVFGCAGWDVPPNVMWGISERGLAWDGEWCVMADGNGVPLGPGQHPRLTLIKPILDIEHGKLTLNAQGTSAGVKKLSSLSVSLWDSPVEQSHKDVDHLPVDCYRSEIVRSFFTNILGVPSTLARFRDQRRVAEDKQFSVPSVPDLKKRLVSVSLPGKRSSINLTLPSAPTCMQNRYLMISQHVFEKLEVCAANTACNSWRIVHLRDAHDRSAEAQNPCIRIGDEVRSFSTFDGLEESKTKAVLALDNVRRYVCAVWNCQKVLSSDLDLRAHIQSHKSGTRSSFCLGRIAGLKAKGKFSDEGRRSEIDRFTRSIRQDLRLLSPPQKQRY